MISSHHHFPDPNRSRWSGHLLLVASVLLGLSLTAMARHRQTLIFRFWNPANVAVMQPVNPVKTRATALLLGVRRARRFWDAEKENETLLREVSRLHASNQILREDLQRLERLTGLDRWGGPPDIVFMPGNVIGRNTYDGALLVIDRGKSDGIQPRDPVVALQGLVGVIRSVTGSTAVVQLLSDPLSVVGVVSAGNRTRGVVYGRGMDQPLEFVPENEVQPITTGTLLISSGFSNSVFPKGLVIGTIESKRVDPYGLPVGIVRPAVTIEDLEEVLLIVPRSRAGHDSLDAMVSPLDPHTSGTGSIQVVMPPEGLSGFTLTTETQALLYGWPTTATLTTTGTLVSTGTLTVPKPPVAPPAPPPVLPAVRLPSPRPAATPYPSGTPASPVPSVESFNERQRLENEQWRSDWNAGGNR